MSTNLLLLPELREMIANNDRKEMEIFCSALHPASTAGFLQCLEPHEIWTILKSISSSSLAAEIFSYFDRDIQVSILENSPRSEVAKLLEETPSDDRVDLLDEVDPKVVEELTSLLSKEDQKDVALLSAYEDDTCGAEMSSDFVRLRADMTVKEAISEISVQTHLMETVYYLYVLDEEGRLAGVISARELLRRINQQDERIANFMKERHTLITVNARESREKAVMLVEKYDFIAIPVIDEVSDKMLGVITHDDVLDAAVEELVENAHLSAAVSPLDDETYLGAKLWVLARKRFLWLAILLFTAALTAFTLKIFDDVSRRVVWLVAFLPMIVSSGGNSGGQSATLVITALATGEISLSDWKRIVLREIEMGLILGLGMGGCGLINSLLIYGTEVPLLQLMIVPLAVVFVVFFSNLTGAFLPLVFQKLGFDPALMSNPVVAGASDIIGSIIYMGLAALCIAPLYPL